MTVIPETVAISCPRCDVPIECTLKSQLPPAKPGEKAGSDVALTVPDLADRMAEHYRQHHSVPFLEVSIDPHRKATIQAGVQVISGA